MIRIVRKSTLDSLKQKLEYANGALEYYIAELNTTEHALEIAEQENRRLFQLHNKRLTKPKPDKNGNLHGRDGKFVRKS